MYSSYFTRVYFSRYFYTTFRSNLSKYSKFDTYVDTSFYFYSDPYYFNKKVKILRDSTLSLSRFAVLDKYKSSRSYFFPLGFIFNNNYYDFSWFPYQNNKEFFKKFFIVLIRVKITAALNMTNVKIFKNYFIRALFKS